MFLSIFPLPLPQTYHIFGLCLVQAEHWLAPIEVGERDAVKSMRVHTWPSEVETVSYVHNACSLTFRDRSPHEW